MENTNFKIMIFKDEDYEEIVPLSEYLDNNDIIEIDLDFSSSAFMYKFNNKELLGAEYDFGQLNLLALQLEEVIKRLENGNIGLLRSAKHDNIYAPYLVFEPLEDQVLISIIYFSGDYDNYFPIDNLIGNCRSEDLYNHVNKNLEEVLKGKQDDLYKPNFTRMPYKKIDLDISLTNIIKEINELYIKKDKELKLEFYFNNSY